jgi:hypothetical protein
MKIDFRSLSPRAFIFIRQIMTMLLNSHLVVRLIMMKRRKNLDSFTKYKRLKQSLNEFGTFASFLWKFAENWDGESRLNNIHKANDNNELPVDAVADIIVPKRNRIKFFNAEVGKNFRLSQKSHILINKQKPKRRCLLCWSKTSCKCNNCSVFLCMYVHGKNRLSCFVKFHTLPSIKLDKRAMKELKANANKASGDDTVITSNTVDATEDVEVRRYPKRKRSKIN